MVKNKLEEGTDFETLGIVGIQESDRIQLDTRGAMQITKFYFDYKTKYWNEILKTGTPIVKFNGFDIATGEPVKYFTLSSVIYKNFLEVLLTYPNVIKKDENQIEWYVFKKPLNIKGFEKVETGDGKNPYIKIKTS